MVTMDAADELRSIARRLREAGNGGMMRRVSAAMRQEARPMVVDVKAAALERLPHRGGLAARVAGERVTVSVTTGARTAGVRLLMRAHDAKATNAGYVRHPVYGRSDSWVTQQIPRAAGWWTDTLRARSGRVRSRVVEAMRQTANDIMRGA
jgi:hypothetical protein